MALHHEKMNYVEFPAKNLEATKSFFEAAFGWSFVVAASTDKGSALIVFYSERLEETLSKIEKPEGAS